MEITIREWSPEDVPEIGALWLEALGEGNLAGMEIAPDAGPRLQRWLLDRTRERSVLGVVAEANGRFAGFLLGRTGRWDASPPIVRPMASGLIDVVSVAAAFRRRGIGGSLVDAALRKMEARGVERVETTFVPGDPAARRLWERTGFRTSLQRAWRGVGEGRGTGRA
jgi:ribosomal protein S18 acetylase RimI-like enzyme